MKDTEIIYRIQAYLPGHETAVGEDIAETKKEANTAFNRLAKLYPIVLMESRTFGDCGYSPWTLVKEKR